MSRGRLCRCWCAVVKVCFQGQLRGRRRMWQPEWLTSRPGSDRSRLRTVAAMVRCFGVLGVAEAGCPAGEVVCERGAGQPSAVGEEVP